MQPPSRSKYFDAANIVVIVFALAAWAAPGGKEKKSSVSTIRWAEGKPGCTFTRDEDGKYRYGLQSDDVGITLAVDSQELQRSRRHFGRFIGAVLTFRYTGPSRLDVRNDHIKLEFMSHSHVVQKVLDPDDFSAQYQYDVDSLIHEKEREIKQHPEKKQEIETTLQAYQKELLDMQEFLRTRSLRSVRLDRATPETKGWVFFSTNNKWIGDWKKREDFVLRISLANRVFEFPFTLPPVEGDLILRRRGEN